MSVADETGLRSLVEDLRAITPSAGASAVLRVVAESARRRAGARFAAIVPERFNQHQQLITLAVDGYQPVWPFEPETRNGLAEPFNDPSLPLGSSQSLLRVPIEVRGREFCVLYLMDPIGPEGFSPGAADWLDDMAALAGLAVEHSLHTEEVAVERPWAATFESVKSDGRAVHMTEALQEIARTALRLSRTQCAAVATTSGDVLEVRAVAGENTDRLLGSVVPSGLSLMGQVIATLETHAVADASDSPRTYVPLSRAVDLGPAVVIPLQHEGEPIGSLLLGNQRGGEPVDVTDVVETLSVDARLRVVLGIADEDADDDGVPILRARGTDLWDARLDALSRRELVVLGLLGEGMTNEAISKTLFLSEKTVRNYVSNTLCKLGMRRVEAAVHASRILAATQS